MFLIRVLMIWSTISNNILKLLFGNKSDFVGVAQPGTAVDC